MASKPKKKVNNTVLGKQNNLNTLVNISNQNGTDLNSQHDNFLREFGAIS